MTNRHTTRQRGMLDTAIIAIAATILAAVLLHAWAYNKGYSAATAVAARDKAALQQAHDAELKRQQDAADTARTSLQTEAAAIDRKLQESQAHAKELQTTLDRALRSGDQRLSIRAASCAAVLPADRAAQPAAAGPEETGAELYPEDAADLHALTADADDTARELNTCIDRYNSAAETIERYRKTLKGSAHVEARQHP